MTTTFSTPTNSERPSRTSAYQLQRQKNLRMALVLASIAVVFFVGFVAKMALLH